MIKNIIWDFDGTLFDTYPAINGAALEALKALGYEMPLDAINSLFMKSLNYCIHEISRRFNLDAEKYSELFWAYNARVSPEEQKPFAGAREVCEFILDRDGKNFIVTHRGKEGALVLLDYYAMRHFFSDCIFGDDGYAKKPDPQTFNLLIEKKMQTGS